MSSDPYILDLYIHPDAGPIKQMKLDLMKVEDVAKYGHPGDLEPDVERVRKAGEQITRRFPKIDIDSNRQGLKLILARFSHIYHFNGIVLRLRGSTLEDTHSDGMKDDDSIFGVAHEDVQKLRSQVDLLDRKMSELKRDLAIEQQERRAVIERYRQVEKEKQQLERDRDTIYERNKFKIEQLHAQVVQREAEINRVRQDADTIVREHASVQMQVTQLKQRNADLEKSLADLQARLTEKDSELAQHRQHASQFKRNEDQLRQAIKDREEEVKLLQDRLKTLAASPVDGSNDADIMLH